MTMDRIEQAVQAEADGELGSAAKAYGLVAFSYFFDENYEYGAGLRRGVSYILESMSADVRAGNCNRASINFETTERFFRDCISEPADPVLVGLGWEWLGDAELLLQRPTAKDHYSKAIDQFEQISLDDQLFWGAEPEYDNAYGAMKRYFESVDVEYPSDHSTNFTGRVNFKIDESS